MSVAPEIRIMTDSQELAYEAAELFVWLGEQTMAACGRFRVALSGGTTPKGLYAALAGPDFATKLAWPRVDFYFSDERCVPPDHPDSNYRRRHRASFAMPKLLSGCSGGPHRSPANNKTTRGQSTLVANPAPASDTYRPASVVAQALR